MFLGNFVHEIRWPIRASARSTPRNISNVQHTTSKYFKCVAHHLEIFRTRSTPSRSISNAQHTTAKYFKCAAHRLEIFQMCSTPPQYFERAAHHRGIFRTRSTPSRNISNAQHTTAKCFKRTAHHLEMLHDQIRQRVPKDLHSVAFLGAVASSRQGPFHSLCRYKGPRALNLPGSVSLPRHLTRVYG